jgi:hypothetical protein
MLWSSVATPPPLRYAGVAGELGAVEVLLAVVAAGLEHDHVEPRGREHAGRGAAAGA